VEFIKTFLIVQATIHFQYHFVNMCAELLHQYNSSKGIDKKPQLPPSNEGAHQRSSGHRVDGQADDGHKERRHDCPAQMSK
jgi:hypothetical protein